MSDPILTPEMLAGYRSVAATYDPADPNQGDVARWMIGTAKIVVALAEEVARVTAERDEAREELRVQRANFAALGTAASGVVWEEAVVAAERAAVVAWLKADRHVCRACLDEGLTLAADAIERGEHRKETPEEREQMDQIKRLEAEGHRWHCARRMVWGDGECECKERP